MKAVVTQAPFTVLYQDVPEPDIPEGFALIRVIETGICGGDIHVYTGNHPYGQYPSIQGHEFVGIVEQVPENARGIASGDRVVGEILLPCGKCYPCRHKKPNCCAELKLVGLHTPGSFAQRVAVPVQNLHAVPEGMPDDVAVLVEPYAIGHHAIARSGITADETALVIGCGTIGLTIIDLLSAMGVRVLAADLSSFRQRKAEEMGADVVIDSAQEDLHKRVMELTMGEGAGVVYEATGSSRIMGQTESLVAAGGTITIVGLTNDSVSFSGLNFTKREMSIHGSRNSCGDFAPVIEDLASGKLHPQSLLTRKFRLADAAEALDYTVRHLGEEGKVVFTIN